MGIFTRTYEIVLLESKIADVVLVGSMTPRKSIKNESTGTVKFDLLLKQVMVMKFEILSIFSANTRPAIGFSP
jgi:hypothetical protein